MNVYVVEEGFKYEGSAVIGIYSTAELAEKAALKLVDNWARFNPFADIFVAIRPTYWLRDEIHYISIRDWVLDS